MSSISVRSLARALAILTLLPVAAIAHEKRAAGALRLTIGWAEEPAFTATRNAVEVEVTDAAGAPVIDPAASLTVEIAFGDQRTVLPLVAVPQHPGRLQAWIVPTRAGAYTFHVTGTIRNHPVDITSSCSDRTFECVSDVAELQFPAKDPSAGQLGESVSRALPRTERATADAARARTMSLAAVGMAALALAAVVGTAVRRNRRDA